MSEIKSPWPGPKGLIPVTSGKAEDANVHNRNYLDSILVEMRVIDSVEPDLSVEIFGRKYSSPIRMERSQWLSMQRQPRIWVY